MAGSHESAGSGPGPPGQGGARDGKGRSTLGPARSARNSGGNEEVQGCVGLGRVFDAGRSLGARQATLGASDTVDTSSSDPPGASASRAVDTPSDHPERPASAPGIQVGIVPASCLSHAPTTHPVLQGEGEVTQCYAAISCLESSSHDGGQGPPAPPGGTLDPGTPGAGGGVDGPPPTGAPPHSQDATSAHPSRGGSGIATTQNYAAISRPILSALEGIGTTVPDVPPLGVPGSDG